jgi:HEAT repeat protein
MPTPSSISNTTPMAQHIEALFKSGDPHERQEAAEGLRLLAEVDPTLAVPLIRLAYQDADHHVRQEATKAVSTLAVSDYSLAHDLFLELFEGKTGDPMSLEPVRQLNLLCEIAPTVGAPILRDLLADRENLADNYAAFALAPLADADPALGAQLIEIALGDSDADLRQKAAAALKTLAKTDPAKASPLIERALKDESMPVRDEAEWAKKMLK